ncbi:SRPBCC domain-containing protein [Kutzneria buriramensis]|uniref:Activator of Hsp90 ATPase-like protein n=1 Tax=Kutzneria buriramensis TaxID=1045776 RepID=A0A3E0HFX4_9PSEU|nr:SRPBCC domain-containing protein [Kutzneria buriramensis]REH43705.1 activator of Hsp90 ATPase-like protein [Kutzneria buriramensis]
MTDYQKTITVQAGPDVVFDALTTTDGLTAWWTTATGSGEAGGELAFSFNQPQPCVMRVDRADRPTSVRWTVTDCPFLTDWVGTRPTFDIVPLDGGASELRFRHHGLTEELDCITDCTSGWNHFMESLRRYVEVGRGMPNGSKEDLARRG